LKLNWIRRLAPLAAAVIAVFVGADGARAQEDDGMFSRRKPKPAETAPAEKPKPQGELQPLPKQTGAWSIVLASFRGEQQQQQAREMLARIQGQRELAGAFIEGRGGGRATVVAVGKFADPSSPEAMAKLERVRAVEVAEKKPFVGAFLAPPGELTDLGQRPEFNLARAKEQFGARAEYTLQVAAYGRKDILDKEKRDPTEAELKEARRLAEEAVATLRKEGELAFFYHGRRYSSVTIGVWSERDFATRPAPGSEERPRTENPELSELRRRFPHNLYNGEGVKVTTRKDGEAMQSSTIVRIPER